jgi:hypothetical protein
MDISERQKKPPVTLSFSRLLLTFVLSRRRPRVRVPSLQPTLQDVHFSFERLQIARLASINASSAMRLTPITGRHAFPGAKGATERVRIFETKQVCGLIQLQDGVGEVVPSHLVVIQLNPA